MLWLQDLIVNSEIKDRAEVPPAPPDEVQQLCQDN